MCLFEFVSVCVFVCVCVSLSVYLRGSVCVVVRFYVRV